MSIHGSCTLYACCDYFSWSLLPMTTWLPWDTTINFIKKKINIHNIYIYINNI